MASRSRTWPTSSRSTTGFIYPYAKQDLRARLQGPSAKHLLGTDSIGRDILSRLLYGARTAVMVSFGAVFISETMRRLIGIMSRLLRRLGRQGRLPNRRRVPGLAGACRADHDPRHLRLRACGR